MSHSSQALRYRREFLRFLAASPLLAYGAQDLWAQPAAAPLAKDVLSVMDFEELARSRLPPAHWGYLASGVDDNLTLQANVAAYKKHSTASASSGRRVEDRHRHRALRTAVREPDLPLPHRRASHVPCGRRDGHSEIFNEYSGTDDRSPRRSGTQNSKTAKWSGDRRSRCRRCWPRWRARTGISRRTGTAAGCCCPST